MYFILVPPTQVAVGETTTCASGVFVPKDRVQGAKVRTSISASWNGMQQQHATPSTTATNQLRISTEAVGVHNAAIIAICIMHNFLPKGACPYACGGIIPCNLHWWCFPSICRRRYCACTRATCTVWWWSRFVVGVVVVVAMSVYM